MTVSWEQSRKHLFEHLLTPDGYKSKVAGTRLDSVDDALISLIEKKLAQKLIHKYNLTPLGEDSTHLKTFEVLSSELLQSVACHNARQRAQHWHVGNLNCAPIVLTQFLQYHRLSAQDHMKWCELSFPEVELPCTLTPNLLVWRRFLEDDPIERPSDALANDVLIASFTAKGVFKADCGRDVKAPAYEILTHAPTALPHRAVITAEVLPYRLSSCTMGSADIDCVYHVALPELLETLQEIIQSEQSSMFFALEDSVRLFEQLVNMQVMRDISDIQRNLGVK